ncbi:MAG: hypothetical protein IKD44_04745 [Lentisphaeria bacterium]|nr:hypothetical protein [Lentisphaeria bacterium]
MHLEQFREPQQKLWDIAENGLLVRKVRDGEPAWQDSLELSGLSMSVYASYGVTCGGRLSFSWTGTWIALRTIPVETCSATFQAASSLEELPSFTADGAKVTEFPREFRFDGILHIVSMTPEGIEIKRSVFASPEGSCALQQITVTNCSGKSQEIGTTPGADFPAGEGGRGLYPVTAELYRSRGRGILAPGEKAEYTLAFCARTPDQAIPRPDGRAEMSARYARIAQLTAPLQLYTGVPELDNEFYFSKLRAGENIFRTRAGLLHSPGGKRYYASVWANDQLEYAAPWFGFTGDPAGIEASLRAFELYIPFMGSEYKPIPSSIVSEGVGYWNKRGDRGDAAMYACGAARFALASGEYFIALKLKKPIEWCLEFCRRKLNPAGVPESDTDELETRLPSGSANLCTAALYYDALRMSVCLERDLGDMKRSAAYAIQAEELERNMERYFGSSIHGFDTYRYYDGCEVLRAWMGIPLCMGIFRRAADTVEALFSERLWIGGGMLSAEGDEKVWDRSALYAFRGAFYAGCGERIFPMLKDYSAARLTGEHIPYPFEAWPENDCRQTSAESALYARIFTEGWFGIAPAGLRSFTVRPNSPPQVSESELCNVPAFGHRLDFSLKGGMLEIRCDGESLAVTDGSATVEIPE